jgi:hypothetical protein
MLNLVMWKVHLFDTVRAESRLYDNAWWSAFHTRGLVVYYHRCSEHLTWILVLHYPIYMICIRHYLMNILYHLEHLQHVVQLLFSFKIPAYNGKQRRHVGHKFSINFSCLLAASWFWNIILVQRSLDSGNQRSLPVTVTFQTITLSCIRSM